MRFAVSVSFCEAPACDPITKKQVADPQLARASDAPLIKTKRVRARAQDQAIFNRLRVVLIRSPPLITPSDCTNDRHGLRGRIPRSDTTCGAVSKRRTGGARA